MMASTGPTWAPPSMTTTTPPRAARTPRRRRSSGSMPNPGPARTASPAASRPSPPSSASQEGSAALRLPRPQRPPPCHSTDLPQEASRPRRGPRAEVHGARARAWVAQGVVFREGPVRDGAGPVPEAAPPIAGGGGGEDGEGGAHLVLGECNSSLPLGRRGEHGEGDEAGGCAREGGGGEEDSCGAGDGATGSGGDEAVLVGAAAATVAQGCAGAGLAAVGRVRGGRLA
ncbi:unnamed protein product [Musa textilis]